MLDSKKCQIISTLLNALRVGCFGTLYGPTYASVRIMLVMQSELFTDTTLKPTSIDWTPTRAAGLARLTAFAPLAGPAYARGRNSDLGPTDRSNVSCLSPWLSRRMITEDEVIAAVLKHHSFAAAEKFIQEVFWRTYWKGWLELRPSVLTTFNQERLALQEQVQSDAILAKRLATAMTGETGIACFDAWVGELIEFGWLHNHARMWFASIWIFTLGLPWQLGADFFYKHLLDGDAASNTLSWRWVAGLHTKGKHYVARASNIATHTMERFKPFGQLNETAFALSVSYQVPGPGNLISGGIISAQCVGLLITQEDLHPISLGIGAKVIGAACLVPITIGPVDSPSNQFARGAMSDVAARTGDDFGVDVVQVSSAQDIIAWAKSLSVQEIVTGYAPTGLVSWHLKEVSAALASVGITLIQIRRPWDNKTWPLATGGFFKLKEKLPSLIQALVAT
jgi:deoxyribodipyrimidine photo-lyase